MIMSIVSVTIGHAVVQPITESNGAMYMSHTRSHAIPEWKRCGQTTVVCVATGALFDHECLHAAAGT